MRRKVKTILKKGAEKDKIEKTPLEEHVDVERIAARIIKESKSDWKKIGERVYNIYKNEDAGEAMKVLSEISKRLKKRGLKLSKKDENELWSIALFKNGIKEREYPSVMGVAAFSGKKNFRDILDVKNTFEEVVCDIYFEKDDLSEKKFAITLIRNNKIESRAMYLAALSEIFSSSRPDKEYSLKEEINNVWKVSPNVGKYFIDKDGNLDVEKYYKDGLSEKEKKAFRDVLKKIIMSKHVRIGYSAASLIEKLKLKDLDIFLLGYASNEERINEEIDGTTTLIHLWDSLRGHYYTQRINERGEMEFIANRETFLADLNKLNEKEKMWVLENLVGGLNSNYTNYIRHRKDIKEKLVTSALTTLSQQGEVIPLELIKKALLGVERVESEKALFEVVKRTNIVDKVIPELIILRENEWARRIWGENDKLRGKSAVEVYNELLSDGEREYLNKILLRESESQDSNKEKRSRRILKELTPEMTFIRTSMKLLLDPLDVKIKTAAYRILDEYNKELEKSGKSLLEILEKEKPGSVNDITRRIEKILREDIGNRRYGAILLIDVLDLHKAFLPDLLRRVSSNNDKILNKVVMKAVKTLREVKEYKEEMIEEIKKKINSPFSASALSNKRYALLSEMAFTCL